jgi:hypothetical protein
MTQQPTGFGRRGAPRASGGARPASPVANDTQPPTAEPLRSMVLRMLVLIPMTVVVVILGAVVVRNNASPPGEADTPGASAASTNTQCRAKATRGGIFDIDWCQAAAAAARGAVAGVAAGAGAARR